MISYARASGVLPVRGYIKKSMVILKKGVERVPYRSQNKRKSRLRCRMNKGGTYAVSLHGDPPNNLLVILLPLPVPLILLHTIIRIRDLVLVRTQIVRGLFVHHGGRARSTALNSSAHAVTVMLRRPHQASKRISTLLQHPHLLPLKMGREDPFVCLFQLSHIDILRTKALCPRLDARH